MDFKRAGGTDGGSMSFLIGLIMMCGGGYLLFNRIIVSTNFGFGRALYSWGTMPVTGGMILIPFIFGVGFIFYNARNPIGWALAAGSLIALVFGVISNLNIRIVTMSAFDLIVILVLLVGGIGLFLASLRNKH